MKKIFILLTLFTFSCSKSDTPQPEVIPQQIQPTTPNSVYYNFEGVWECDNWVVDHTTGVTRKRQFMFFNQQSTTMSVSLNQYTSNGTHTQLYSNGTATVDSNYFDNHSNVVPMQFKGVLITDSTLMVYEYDGSDTTQVKEFKKN